MNKNIGKIDKIVRLIIAITASALFITKTVTGTLGYILLGVGAIMLLTAIIDFCPLYKVCKFKGTNKQ
ncbi:MAG: YgaP family membrane protein [Vicingaceae bacterium]